MFDYYGIINVQAQLIEDWRLLNSILLQKPFLKTMSYGNFIKYFTFMVVWKEEQKKRKKLITAIKNSV